VLRKHSAPRLVYVALLASARSRCEDLLGELRALLRDPLALQLTNSVEQSRS
jgi:hypothetical protein